jgi:hypothetical protein
MYRNAPWSNGAGRRKPSGAAKQLLQIAECYSEILVYVEQ